MVLEERTLGCLSIEQGYCLLGQTWQGCWIGVGREKLFVRLSLNSSPIPQTPPPPFSYFNGVEGHAVPVVSVHHPCTRHHGALSSSLWQLALCQNHSWFNLTAGNAFFESILAQTEIP